jgi:molybdopterin synthase catalytic subunit
MQVTVAYFGALRDIAGRERDLHVLAEGATLENLYRQLLQQFPSLANYHRSIAISINYEYADLASVLHDGDEVGLLPPVSGGQPNSERLPGAEPVSIVHSPLHGEQLLRDFPAAADGAVVLFDGVVRNHSRGRRTLYLDYSAYPEMALKELHKLADTARGKFDIRDVRIAHRLGRLEIGETSVLIAVASAHRAAAFDACRWIIDTLKQTVPIWKKEHFEDGAVWADGEPFPPAITVSSGNASKSLKSG